MEEFQFRFCCLAATSGALMGLLAVWAGLGRAHWFVRVASVALALALLLPGLAYYQMLTPAPIPQVALPSPNGYDELIRVGRMLKDQIVPDTNTANQAQLEAFVTQHVALLGAVRTALDHPSQVRVDYAQLTTSGLNDVGEIVQVMKAVSAQSKLAEMTGRVEDSLTVNSDRVRLGEAAEHGGLLVHWLIGQAIQGAGLEELSGTRDSLSPEQSRDLIATLQSVEAAAEPVAAIVARDAVWEQHSQGWLPRVSFLNQRFEHTSPTIYDQVRNRTVATSRLLVCDLALRIYEADHGRVPQRLTDLVPGYLSAVPCDPFSGMLPIYRRTDESYALYSVGADGVDNGGVAGTNNGMLADTDLVLPAARENLPNGAP